jgi:hypothetical protein
MTIKRVNFFMQPLSIVFYNGKQYGMSISALTYSTLIFDLPASLPQ